MKIHEYYRDTAKMNLNGSIVALFPAILIVGGNILFFHSKDIMALCIPFLIYSLISFQIYLFRMKQSLLIAQHIVKSEGDYHRQLFGSKYLLVLRLNTLFPQLLFYHPNGHLVGVLKQYRGKGINFINGRKQYALYEDNQIQGIYKTKGRKIEVYDETNHYLGFFENTKKGKREILNADGKFLSAVQGATSYLDERIVDNNEKQIGRLRRGWMPVEWSNFFPEPNTPVLTFSEKISVKDKLLNISFLIQEYFIKR